MGVFQVGELCLGVVLVTVACWTGVEGLPTGAPMAACGSMTPGHGTEQTGPNPYSISVMNQMTKYTPGTPLTIQVVGSGDFRGILLQARLADGSSTTPVGTFQDPDASSGSKVRLLQCSTAGDAITHVSALTNTIAGGLELTWMPPMTDVGNVYFVATVAREKMTWWKGAESSQLAYDSSGAVSEPSTEPSAEPTTSAGDTSAAAVITFSCLTLFAALYIGRQVRLSLS